MVIKKYSKASKDIWDINETFIKQNDDLVKENYRLSKIYNSCPKRKICKICSESLVTPLFNKQNVDYYHCGKCGHLNGGYDETDEFVKAVYLDEETKYDEYYRVSRQQYLDRVKKIYKPKADFLVECLRELSIDYENLRYCDFGAGSGYFVYTLVHDFGLNNVIGYEASYRQVDFANEMLGSERIKCNEMEEIGDILRKSDAEIISLIGVLEHLQDPNSALQEIADNPNVQYVYLLLPLFSFNVFVEYFNQNHYNRFLSGGHTHLYTPESISYFCNKYGFETVGEWYFGSELLDLYRSIYLKMEDMDTSDQFRKIFFDNFLPIIDNLQSVLDCSEFCSGLHILLRKKG
jgi:2-polyprenyl-3-methyl-5-hydroxy-6-metoxy-1,4-benzoquinol methylase